MVEELDLPVDNRFETKNVGNSILSGFSHQNPRMGPLSNDDRLVLGEAIPRTFQQAGQVINQNIRRAVMKAMDYQVSDLDTPEDVATTLLSACVTPDQRLVTGTIGNSRAYIVVRKRDSGEVKVYAGNKADRQLIRPIPSEKRTGVPEPLMHTVDLTKVLAEPMNEVYVMLASEGAKDEVITSPDFGNGLSAQLRHMDTLPAASQLGLHFARKTPLHNISFAIAKIPADLERPIAMTLCDGSKWQGDFAESVAEEMQHGLMLDPNTRCIPVEKKRAPEQIEDRHEIRQIGNAYVHASCIHNGRKQDDSYAIDEGAHTDEARIVSGMRRATARCIDEAIETTDRDNKPATTLTSIYITPQEKFICGNIGDSPAYIVQRDKATGDITFEQISETHNLANPLEQIGKEEKALVAYFTEESKAADKGPEWLKKMLSATATKAIAHPDRNGCDVDDLEVRAEDLTARLADPTKQTAVLVTTDGVSPELLNTPEFKAFLSEQWPAGKGNIAQAITEYMKNHGSRDNITAAFVELPARLEVPININLGDGVSSARSFDLAQFAVNACVDDLGKSKYIAPETAARIPSEKKWKSAQKLQGGENIHCHVCRCKNLTQKRDIVGALTECGIPTMEDSSLRINVEWKHFRDLERVFAVQDPDYYAKKAQSHREIGGLLGLLNIFDKAQAESEESPDKDAKTRHRHRARNKSDRNKGDGAGEGRA